MPNCFTLTRKGATEPSSLNAIDGELCIMLGKPVHPDKYVRSWYGLFGFALACGTQLDDIRMDEMADDDPELIAILKHLREHYDANAWYETKR